MTAGKAATGFTKSRWFALVWMIPLAIVILAVIVFAARALRDSPWGQSFMTEFPGASELPDTAPVGLPAWLNWQHGLNVFFLLFIIRSGWQVRTATRPSVFWTRNNTGLIRTKTPPTKIGLTLWLHLSLDTLWVLNGILFYILIFATGQWMRIVPLHWDIVPNALSTAIQYASLYWPTENGWENYNALQTLSYFAIVFIAAPLAIITGLRMSPAWSKRFGRINRVYPIEVARALHFPTMIFFVLFIVVHVILVLATGALRNLNHMYWASSSENWFGFGIFAASLVVMIVAWVAASPVVLRSLAALTGKVSR
jgi:thiosulfate reductase cytochrome b subunit